MLLEEVVVASGTTRHSLVRSQHRNDSSIEEGSGNRNSGINVGSMMQQATLLPSMFSESDLGRELDLRKRRRMQRGEVHTDRATANLHSSAAASYRLILRNVSITLPGFCSASSLPPAAAIT